MNRADLRRQNALVESTVACAQYSSAIGGELGRDSEPWRHHVPRVQRAEAADDTPCFPPLVIDRREVLKDRAVPVEAQAGIDRQPVTDRHGISREESGRDEFPAAH